MNRTERLYKIQKLLQAKQVVHIDDFLQSLEISRATFRRDLEYLRDRLGAPIVWDRERNGYSLAASADGASPSHLPGMWFTEREVHALLTMMHLVSDLDPASMISKQIEPVRDRLEKILDSGCSDADELTHRVRILPIARRNVSDDLFQTLADCLIRRKRIDIRHYSRQTGVESLRQVSPQQLVYYRDNWYLDAFCHQRDDIRCFSVDAILEARETDKPAVSLPQETIRNAYEDNYGIFSGIRQQMARLRFTPFRARWVAKEIWHRKQSSRFDADGYYILELPYADDRELILDILRQGPDCEVLAPDTLRAAVADRLRHGLALYQTA